MSLKTIRSHEEYGLHPSVTVLLVLQLLLLHMVNGLFSRTTWVSRYQKGKNSLDLSEARDDGVLGCSGISWTICKRSVPHSRQLITPIPHHSIFTGRTLFLTPNQQCQSTEGNSQAAIISSGSRIIKNAGKIRTFGSGREEKLPVRSKEVNSKAQQFWLCFPEVSTYCRRVYKAI